MNAFYFGPKEAPLFGMYTPPRVSVARAASVLICPPVGLEYMRTHYAIRLLANQLADAGLHVLRFDYHGTGDSSGDIGTGQFAVWAEDVRIAVRELAEISDVEIPVIVGLRLGAVLAIEALAMGPIKAQALVLWDPVVSGGQYLEGLERLHQQMVEARAAALPQADELLGARYPADLREAVRRFPVAQRLLGVESRRAALVVSGERPGYSALLAAMRDGWPDAPYRLVDDPTDWENLRAAFDARLTGPVVRAVAEVAQGVI